jgi:LPS-assembly lipoprotein
MGARFGAVLGCALLAMALSGCGFRPLYGDMGRTGAAQVDLSQIAIEPTQDRTGQRLRQILIQNLTPKGEPARPKYRLFIDITEVQDGVGLRVDYTFTRINYRLKGAYKLVDNATGATIVGGEVRGVTAYNVGANQVATLTAEVDARERASNDLAQDLQLRLAVFFESRGKAK